MSQQPTFVPFSFDVRVAAAPNPFAPAAEPPARAAVADAVWSHDASADDEAGLLTSEAVDVRVLWGTNVLHFEQMSPPRPFTLGEAGSDFTIPELAVGAFRGGSCPLVVVHEERPAVFVAHGASADVKLANGSVLSLVECIAGGFAHRSAVLASGHEILVPPGAMATVRLAGSELIFEVTRGRARQQPETGLLAGADVSGCLYTGLSALAHVALIGALAFFLPAMRGDDADSVDRNMAAAMQPYLAAIAEREVETPQPLESVVEGASSTSGGGHGSQATGPSGLMGTTRPAATPGRFAIQGDTKDSKVARDRALSEAASFGMLGLLNTDASAINAPVAPWGESAATGHDPRRALGALWASTIDDAMGTGLGVSGTEEGGGGRFTGIGLTGIGSTIGGGSGGCVGDGPCPDGPGHGPGPGGFGLSHGPTEGGHVAKAPIMRTPNLDVNGTLPAEVVQRVVRQNFGRFKICYEAGLRSNPGLTGRVAVAFMIDRTGSVAVAAADRSTDIADPQVVSCVVRGFQNLSFPEPKNGLVKVIYPLLLSPGE